MNAETPKIARLASETVTAATQNAHSFAEAGATQARVAMEKGMEQLTKSAEGAFKAAEEFAEFSRGNAEIFATVAQTWFTGTQDLSRQAFAMVQGLTDHALEGARALSGVKSLKEAAEIQATYTRGALDKVMTETARLQESSFKLAEQVSTPIAARAKVAMEKVATTRPMAA
ncbi:phasin family protein [Roseomonas sp. CCTCC AB2023176]|uniref:phasin family protein n=1 Tax=Roseomonas sp. CCTCC AB2023176 TaxID=3342640 RepID=UPI0035DDD268